MAGSNMCFKVIESIDYLVTKMALRTIHYWFIHFGTDFWKSRLKNIGLHSLQSLYVDLHQLQCCGFCYYIFIKFILLNMQVLWFHVFNKKLHELSFKPKSHQTTFACVVVTCYWMLNEMNQHLESENEFKSLSFKMQVVWFGILY